MSLARMHLHGFCVVLSLGLMLTPAVALAQDEGPKPPASASRLELRLPPLAAGSAAPVRAGQPQPARDSFANGALIGAAVGAAALGGFAAILCKAQQEPGGPSCVSDTLRVAAIGAAIGAGAGLVVDAALIRQNGVSVSVGITF